MSEALPTDADWHARLFAFLWSSGTPPAEFSEPGWLVYRNTTQRACLQSLRANYPALAVLLGEEAFDVLARAYLQTHRPSDARLMTLGAELPGFLAQFPPAADWPHLAEVAQLDRHWSESHLAADRTVLDAPAVLNGQLGPQSICVPHPATRWFFSSVHPVASLWLDARNGATERPDLVWQAEGLMLTRPSDHVRATRISAAEHTFLKACAAHLPLEAALETVLSHHPDTQLPAVLAHMLEQGALSLHLH
jgi:hypothetical protein